MRFLYSLLFLLLLPLVLLRLWWRGRKNPDYRRRWRERVAWLPPQEKGGIWVHAVSVGEAIAAIPLIQALLMRYPHLPITVTTMTPTGSDRVRAALHDRVQHMYVPYDVPFLVRRFLQHVQPTLCLIMETELWPNLVMGCRDRHVPTMVINARLSKRSARGYFRARCLSVPLLRAITFIAAQERADARRFRALGCDAKQLAITGSIKSDVRINEAQRKSANALRAVLGTQRYIVIAASTHEGEDEIILAAFSTLKTQVHDAALILVPRHPERFSAVKTLAKSTAFVVHSQSNAQACAHTDILVGDTMGELMILYGAADVAFVGGSLVARGGHNPLEPLAWGMPLAQGSHTFNFDSLNQRLRKNTISTTVKTAADLAQFFLHMQGAVARKAQQERAAEFMNKTGGALEAMLTHIDRLLRV